jgi:hypothetical protein
MYVSGLGALREVWCFIGGLRVPVSHSAIPQVATCAWALPVATGLSSLLPGPSCKPVMYGMFPFAHCCTLRLEGACRFKVYSGREMTEQWPESQDVLHVLHTY